MNQVIAKKATAFALMFGAIIGIISLIPYFIGLTLFTLSFFSSVLVILYMKKNEKHLSYLTNEQGAIIGGLIGFGIGEIAKYGASLAEAGIGKVVAKLHQTTQ